MKALRLISTKVIELIGLSAFRSSNLEPKSLPVTTVVYEHTLDISLAWGSGCSWISHLVLTTKIQEEQNTPPGRCARRFLLLLWYYRAKSSFLGESCSVVFPSLFHFLKWFDSLAGINLSAGSDQAWTVYMQERQALSPSRDGKRVKGWSAW